MVGAQEVARMAGTDGQFDLSMVMKGDASSAVAAANQAEKGIDSVATAQGKASRASRDMATASAGAATAGKEVGRAANEAATATNTLAVAEANLAREFQEARQASTAAVAGIGSVVKAQRDGTKAANDNAAALNRSAFGARNLGQQVGDFATQVSLGGGVVRAFSSQIGQAGFAMSEMGGKIGAVGKFLVGPWGIALTVGALVLGPFVEKLFDGGKAADEFLDKATKAAGAADSFGTAQGILGKAIDLATGKLKTQNVVLIESIRLQALAGIAKARADQQATRSELLAAGNPSLARRIGNGVASQQGLVGGILGGVSGAFGGAGSGVDPKLNDIASRYAQGAIGIKAARQEVEKLGLSAEKTNEALLKFVSYGTAVNDETANQLALDALDGKGIDKRLVPYSNKKGPRPKKPKEDTRTPAEAEEIARLNAEFDETPKLIDRAAQATRRLDVIIADLAKRKPAGFEKLIADANAAKGTIAAGLQRPYEDFVAEQQRGLEVQRLINAGRIDEANALKIVQGLQATMAPLTDAQKEAILASVQALRAEQRELDILRAKNAKYVEALGSIKGIVEDATQAFVRGDLGQLIKSPGKILDAFQTLQGRKLFDSLFGDAFRELEDQANGTSVVKDASARMATAVDKASASIGRLGAAAERAAAGVGGQGAPAAAGGTTTNAEGDIVVTGRRDPIVAALGKVGTSIAGQFTNPENAKRIGASIGKFAGKGLEGAATGSIVAGVGKALGFKVSTTGAQIGGAIGSALPIPGGQVIGSIAGGLIGGLFKKSKSGSASIGNVDGVAGITGTGGNNADYRKAASGLAGSINDTLSNIVSTLGGTLGNFAVSIGQRDGKFVVDNSGRGSTKFGKANDGITAYKTAEEAQSAALANAIADGAIQGLSAAVQRAFRSTDDVDRAVKEALGVKALEDRLGGLGATLKGVFAAEDAAAKERLRLARTYGLDVVAVEKLNAEDRLKLVDQTLKSRIGSLSDFLDQLKYGDLAEGTAADKRTALLDKIKVVQADAEKGTDGAADQLAQLYSQLVTNSRADFGTAGGEYGGDRGLAQTGVEAVIAMERQRVNEAAGAAQATTAAVDKVAAGVSETNDLLARNNAALLSQNALLQSLFGGTGGLGVDYGITARAAALR